MTSMQLQVYTAILSTGFLAIALGVSYTTSSTGGDAMEPGSELRSTPFFLMLIVGLNYFGELRLSYVAINMLGSLGICPVRPFAAAAFPHACGSADQDTRWRTCSDA